jgi:class 3 adenylate cyclase
LAREQRRLAAIVAADVVGYSRLMGRDESGTLARLREHRKQRFEPTLARHGGRLVKLTGDGALAEFPSAVDALSAAVEFQQAMADANLDQSEDTAIVFRIGLHLGDLIVDGDDLYGDGVNVAARLEVEAPPGGIIVSRAVREAVQGRLKANLHALGELTLKITASTSREIDAAFETFVHERPHALFVSPDPFFRSRHVQLTQLATRHAIPATYALRDYAEVGGLMSYGASLPDAFRQGGLYAGRILKGAKPNDLPVLQASKFELVINAQTARMLGLTVPPSLLATADEVIE